VIAVTNPRIAAVTRNSVTVRSIWLAGLFRFSLPE
jgi:hypothetical protein